MASEALAILCHAVAGRIDRLLAQLHFRVARAENFPVAAAPGLAVDARDVDQQALGSVSLVAAPAVVVAALVEGVGVDLRVAVFEVAGEALAVVALDDFALGADGVRLDEETVLAAGRG